MRKVALCARCIENSSFVGSTDGWAAHAITALDNPDNIPIRTREAHLKSLVSCKNVIPTWWHRFSEMRRASEAG